MRQLLFVVCVLSTLLCVSGSFCDNPRFIRHFTSCNTKRGNYRELPIGESECKTLCEEEGGTCAAFQVPDDGRKECLLFSTFKGGMTGNANGYSCYEHRCDGEGTCFNGEVGKCEAPTGWTVHNVETKSLPGCAELCRVTRRCMGFQFKKGSCVLYVKPDDGDDDSGATNKLIVKNSRNKNSQCFKKTKKDCINSSVFPPRTTGENSCSMFLDAKDLKRARGGCRNDVKRLGVSRNYNFRNSEYMNDVGVDGLCKNLCELFDELCKGYETKPSSGRCEIHFTSIDYRQDRGDDRECVEVEAPETCWSEKSGLGYCRDASDGVGNPEFCRGCHDVDDCRNVCLLRTDCTAFEWHEGRSNPRCEIHTSPIVSTEFSTSSDIPLCYIKK